MIVPSLISGILLISRLFLTRLRLPSGLIVRVDVDQFNNLSDFDKFLTSKGHDYNCSQIIIGNTTYERESIRNNSDAIPISVGDEIKLHKKRISFLPRKGFGIPRPKRRKNVHSVSGLAKMRNVLFRLNTSCSTNASVVLHENCLEQIHRLYSGGSQSKQVLLLLGRTNSHLAGIDNDLSVEVLETFPCDWDVSLSSTNSITMSDSFAIPLIQILSALNLAVVGICCPSEFSWNKDHILMSVITKRVFRIQEPFLPVIVLARSHGSELFLEAFRMSDSANALIDSKFLTTLDLQAARSGREREDSLVTLRKPILVGEKETSSLEPVLFASPVAIRRAESGNPLPKTGFHREIDLVRVGRNIRARRWAILRDISVLMRIRDHSVMDSDSFGLLLGRISDNEWPIELPKKLQLLLDAIFPVDEE